MIRILLVDDDKHLLPLLEHILLRNRYHVATAESVATGLSILRSRPFDLLITDVNLPDGIGLTIADEALAAGIKVLVMTAHGLSVKPGKLANYDYLLKPVRIDELLDAVERRLTEGTMASRQLAALVLSDGERKELTSLAARRNTAQALALRARIVLGCADGTQNKDVAERLQVDRATVGKWRRRFVERRIDGLRDERGLARPVPSRTNASRR